MFTYSTILYTHLPANPDGSILYTLCSDMGKQVKWDGYLLYIQVSTVWIQANVNDKQFLST